MDLEEKVTKALRDAFAPEAIKFDNDEGLSGYLVASRFRGMDSIDRQGLIYDALRRPEANLSREELREILAIAAVTPEEYAVLVGDS